MPGNKRQKNTLQAQSLKDKIVNIYDSCNVKKNNPNLYIFVPTCVYSVEGNKIDDKQFELLIENLLELEKTHDYSTFVVYLFEDEKNPQVAQQWQENNKNSLEKLTSSRCVHVPKWRTSDAYQIVKAKKEEIKRILESNAGWKASLEEDIALALSHLNSDYRLKELDYPETTREQAIEHIITETAETMVQWKFNQVTIILCCDIHHMVKYAINHLGEVGYKDDQPKQMIRHLLLKLKRDLVNRKPQNSDIDDIEINGLPLLQFFEVMIDWIMASENDKDASGYMEILANVINRSQSEAETRLQFYNFMINKINQLKNSKNCEDAGKTLNIFANVLGYLNKDYLDRKEINCPPHKKQQVSGFSSHPAPFFPPAERHMKSGVLSKEISVSAKA